MSTTFQEIVSKHAKLAEKLNNDMFVAFGAEHAPVIWAEGGEWPAYREDFKNSLFKPIQRDMEVTYDIPGTMKDIKSFLTRQFHDKSVAGLTFECGAGKSTKVVYAAHEMKLGNRTIVVQPSIVTAEQLAEYGKTQGKPCVFLDSADELSDTRVLCYTNLGTLFSLLALNKLKHSDLIIIDESHGASFVLCLVMEALRRFTMRVLMMTASTSSAIRGLRGVKLVDVQSITPDVSNSYAEHGSKAVMVGVSETQAYLASAAMMIGLTLDLRMVYDTGLRPDPRVVAGVVRPGERQATKGEIIQMVGRLGRLGRTGVGYYNSNAPVFQAEGVAIYDLLLKSIMAAVGMATDNALQDKGAKIWKRSGIIGRPAGIKADGDDAQLPLASPVSVSGFNSPGRSLSIRSRSRGLSRTSEVHSRTSSNTSLNSQVHGAETSEKSGAYLSENDARGRLRSMTHERDGGISLRGFDKELPALPPYDEGLHSGTTVANPVRDNLKTHRSYHVRRHSSSSGQAGSLHVTSNVVNRVTGVVYDVAPDPDWRPFRKVANYIGPLESETGIHHCVERMSHSLDRGDVLYPALFPKADERAVDANVVERTAYVISGDATPTFTEDERLAAAVLWNREVRTLGNKYMARKKARMFLDYFLGYANYERSYM